MAKKKPLKAADSRPKASKASVSLYPPDLERLDRIKAFMLNHGFRNISDSEALRIACRSVEINEKFITVFQQMQQEDLRRR